MAIRVQLDRILLERRMSLTELADRVGVTIANLSILKTGKARAVRFSTLDALCREPWHPGTVGTQARPAATAERQHDGIRARGDLTVRRVEAQRLRRSTRRRCQVGRQTRRQT